MTNKLPFCYRKLMNLNGGSQPKGGCSDEEAHRCYGRDLSCIHYVQHYDLVSEYRPRATIGTPLLPAEDEMIFRDDL